jgi:hypothetical protein
LFYNLHEVSPKESKNRTKRTRASRKERAKTSERLSADAKRRYVIEDESRRNPSRQKEKVAR